MTAVWVMRRLQRRLAQGVKEARLARYSRTIVVYWAFVVVLLTHWIVAGRSATSLGFAASGGLPFIVTMTASVLLALLLPGQIRAARSMTADTAERLRRQFGAVVTVVLPHTTGERSVCLWLLVTAGFCEELWYRGFLIAYLDRAARGDRRAFRGDRPRGPPPDRA